MTESRYRTFHYKTARAEGMVSLQEALDHALREQLTIGERKERMSRTEQTRFVTLTRATEGMLCGTAVVYTQGNHQAIVAVDDALNEVSVHQIAPPEDEKGRRNEFVEGTLFFGVLANHVVLVQSTGFKALQFEEHLNWLLRKGLPGKFSPVRILDILPAALRQAAGWRGVKSVTVRTPVHFSPELPLRTGVASEGNRGLLLLQRAMEVLDQASSEGFRLDELLPANDVELVLQIRQKRRDGRESDVLNELAAVLSNVDDEAMSVEIEVPNFGLIGRDQLQVKQTFRVRADSGLPEAGAVFAKMREWLESLLETHMIGS